MLYIAVLHFLYLRQYNNIVILAVDDICYLRQDNI